MKLNRETLKGDLPGITRVPGNPLYELPEKVLQFGTGVLLRGLPDYYIDYANKQNVFNGRVVVVKSTGMDVDEFASQDGLFTHCVKGIVEGSPVEEYIINAAISKVLPAQQNWKEILKYAESADMQIIISNTTEIGIELKREDDIHAAPPESFPAKLLAFLYRRYQYFKGSRESGMVIIPTELIVDNGNKLKMILSELAAINKLDKKFIEWLDTANDFCNSLVDRIVRGSFKPQEQRAFEKKAGYEDALTIMSEPYSLWAIGSSSEKTKDILSFSKVDKTIIITPDINRYRELKLRLLNGTHTFCCGLAFLAGFELVSESMHENAICQFIKELMLHEIVPCITSDAVTTNEAGLFAKSVIDRFCNPLINHKWISISVNYTAKLNTRCVPLIFEYYYKTGKIPSHMAAGFAAYILFLRPVEVADGVYFGQNQGNKYRIDDTHAASFYMLWQTFSPDDIAQKVLSDHSLWGTDLTTIPGFSAMVKCYLQQFNSSEFKSVHSRLSHGGKVSYEA